MSDPHGSRSNYLGAGAVAILSLVIAILGVSTGVIQIGQSARDSSDSASYNATVISELQGQSILDQEQNDKLEEQIVLLTEIVSKEQQINMLRTAEAVAPANSAEPTVDYASTVAALETLALMGEQEATLAAIAAEGDNDDAATIEHTCIVSDEIFIGNSRRSLPAFISTPPEEMIFTHCPPINPITYQSIAVDDEIKKVEMVCSDESKDITDKFTTFEETGEELPHYRSESIVLGEGCRIDFTIIDKKGTNVGLMIKSVS